MSNTSVAFLAIVLLMICSTSSSPLSLVKGSYVYDPNSIEQNERILNLFVRLAAQTANQLMILKMKTNQSSGNGVGEIDHFLSQKENPVQAPGLRIMNEIDKTSSSVPEEPTLIDSSSRDDPRHGQTLDDISGTEIPIKIESRRDFASANDLGVRDRLLELKAPSSSDFQSFQNEDGDKKTRSFPSSTTLVYDIPRSSEIERNLQTTTVSEEESTSGNDLEAQGRLADHQTPTPGHFRTLFKDKEAEEGRSLLESGLTVNEPVTTVYNVSGLPEFENREEVEIGNRALFNIEKNNYITRYTDQSTNIHKADNTMNNFGTGYLENVVINQKTRPRLRENVNLGISNQGSSTGQIFGSINSSGVSNFGELAMGKQTGNSASSASSSLEVNMNHAKTGASVGSNAQGYELVNLNGVFAQVGNSGDLDNAKEIESYGSKSRKEGMMLQSMSNEKSASSLNHDLNGTFQGLLASSKENLHENESSGNLEGDYQRFRGESSASGNKQREVKTEENRHGESPSLFAISSKNHESLDLQHGLNSRVDYEGQIHGAEGFGNSGQSSTFLKGAYGSGLDLEGQLGTSLGHNLEKKELTSFEDGHLGSVSAGASLEAGSKLEIKPGQSLSVGLGLLGDKVNVFKNAINSKADFGAKLNLSAHVLNG